MYNRAHKHNSTMVSDASPGTVAPNMNKSFVHMAYVSSDRAFAQDGYLKHPHPTIIDINMRWDSGWFWGLFWQNQGTMRGGGGSKIGEIGPGDRFSYTTGLCALINHDSRHCPTATMGPRSPRQSIQQSANILCKRSTFKTKFLLFINIYTTI